jgi:hypothetical protein
VEAACVNVQLDDVAFTHHGEGTPHCRLRCDVEDDGPARCAAHPPVRDSEHILYPLSGELLRDGGIACFGHPGMSYRTDVLEYKAEIE